MQATPEIIKERQERYDRLYRLITGYVRTKQQLKEMEEIKRETQFEITVRYKKSEREQVYVFPKSHSSSPQPELSEQQRVLASRKDILYDLRTQSLVTIQEPRPKRSTIERMQTELVSSDRKGGLSRPNIKPLLNRIDLRIHKLLAKDKLKSTRHLTERSPTERSPHNFGRLSPLKPSAQKPIKKTIRQLTQALQASPIAVSQHINNFRRDRSTHLAPIPKKDLSQQASPRGKDFGRLATEDGKNVSSKKSLKKLHTEEGSIKKRLVIETIMNYQASRAENKANGHVSSMVNIKPKNLFQKNVF